METSPPSPFVSFRGRPTESNKLAIPSKSGRFQTVICGEFTVNRLGNCANVSWSRNAAIATFPLKLPLRILRLPPSSPPKLNHGKSTYFLVPFLGSIVTTGLLRSCAIRPRRLEDSVFGEKRVFGRKRVNGEKHVKE